MESQPQNPEFKNNPENFHPCITFLVLHKHTISKLIGSILGILSMIWITKIFECKIVNVFLPINSNICFGCSKELRQFF